MQESSHGLHRDSRETEGFGGPRDEELLGLVAERPPEDALARIATGDPLQMFRRCAARIREQALLIDPDRLARRAVVQVAYASPDYRGDPPLTEWLGRLVDRSIERILAEDIEIGRTDGRSPDDERYGFAAKLLCLDPALARSACVQFNALRHRSRRSFFALVLEGRSVADAIEHGLGPTEALREACLEAFRALTYLGHDENLPGGVQSDPRDGHE